MTDSDKELLMWLHDRLQHVHGENPNADYMLRLRQFIENDDIPSCLEQDRESLLRQVASLKATLKAVL